MHQELKKQVIKALNDSGFTERKHKEAEGFYLSNWISGEIYLTWTFSQEYIDASSGSLSPQYRQKEKAMLSVLKSAGFHAYSPKNGGHIIVCCGDSLHGTHARYLSINPR